MITKPTVFILGAGASKPYGFPTGPELAGRVIDRLARTNGPDGVFENTEFSSSLALFNNPAVTPVYYPAFVRAFRLSSCGSLDEFVQSKGNRRFLPLVKAATIVLLPEFEQDEMLVPQSGDWIAYLFRYLRTDDPDVFSGNRIKVITFNFDRSFERRLFLMLGAYYGVDDNAAAQLRFAVPVLHLHGSLGGEYWCGERRTESRAFSPDTTQDQRYSLMNAIRIVHEEIDQEALGKAQRWLSEAERICFLGFGYHELTMGRLGMSSPLENATIWGTTLGLSQAERTRVVRLFGVNGEPTRLRLEDTGTLDAFRYLRETAVLPIG